jgi:hypothetical protein
MTIYFSNFLLATNENDEKAILSRFQIVRFLENPHIQMNQNPKEFNNQDSDHLSVSPSINTYEIISISQDQIFYIKDQMFVTLPDTGELFPIYGVLQDQEGLYAITPHRTCMYGHTSACNRCDGCAVFHCYDRCRCQNR